MLFYVAVLYDHSSLLGLFLDLSSGLFLDLSSGAIFWLDRRIRYFRDFHKGRQELELWKNRLWKDE